MFSMQGSKKARVSREVFGFPARGGPFRKIWKERSRRLHDVRERNRYRMAMTPSGGVVRGTRIEPGPAQGGLPELSFERVAINRRGAASYAGRGVVVSSTMRRVRRLIHICIPERMREPRHTYDSERLRDC